MQIEPDYVDTQTARPLEDDGQSLMEGESHGPSVTGDPAQIPPLDVERQAKLKQALVLQMEMQKRLHDQLEVFPSTSFAPSAWLKKSVLTHEGTPSNLQY